MTSRWEFWVRNWRFQSSMIVQWTSNVGGQRVRQGSFWHVQLISPKIISPVGEGAGELLNNLLCGKAPPRDLTPYTFIVEGARRVFFRVGASPYKIQCHSILCRIHLITISLTESRISLSTGVPRASYSRGRFALWLFGNIHIHNIHNKRTVYFIPNFSPSTYTQQQHSTIRPFFYYHLS